MTTDISPKQTDTKYEAVIGLETHAQLITSSKMFCGCSAGYSSARPNSLTCPTCLGLPGALPVPNKKAIEYTIMIGLALNCKINNITKFDRKNYNYPDLLKGYQISQNDFPVCGNGYIDLITPNKRININRAHLEEDVAKMIHSRESSLLDANRSGVPLVEIVTEPDFRTVQEVETYIKALQQIVRYLGVGNAKMEEGSFRCDANISLRPVGETSFGTKVEIKNMNRINAVTYALEYEIERQQSVLASGGSIIQETRGWDSDAKKTFEQRVKENANDYRYFPEPDIPPIEVSAAWVEEVRAKLPELPGDRLKRLMNEHKLSEYDARLITADAKTAKFFDEAFNSIPVSSKNGERVHNFGKDLANWLNGEMINLRRKHQKDSIDQLGISPKNFARLVDKFRRGELNNHTAKEVLGVMAETGKKPSEVIAEGKIKRLDNSDELEQIVTDVIKKNARAVSDYLNDKPNAIKFLVGQVMAATKGQADPKSVISLIEKVSKSNLKQ